jgi:hypothetical protein
LALSKGASEGLYTVVGHMLAELPVSFAIINVFLDQRGPSRRRIPNERLQINRRHKRVDRRVPGQRSPPTHTQWPHEDNKRVELEACDQGAVQGKRIRV